MADLILLHFAEVEGIERVGNDMVLDINVRPDRAADCLSHIGVAGEISAILKIPFKVPVVKIKEGKRRVKDIISVVIKDKIACPRYTARVITNVKMGESPKYIQNRLISCGMRPINNIVDAANYVMLEIGQPLHSFDADKIQGKKIIVRKAVKGEKIETLDGGKFDLDESVLVIADSKSPMVIAGIKGGKAPEIDKNTKNIVIESANFDLRGIRKTSRKINLRTDASLRFEHGLDSNLTEIAINRVASLIQEVAGGEITKGLEDVYPKKNLSKKIILNLEKVERLLGVKIPTAEIIKILKSLNFSVKTLNKNNLQVLVPTIRVDVTIPENLIEDIGRIYGYSKIPTILPNAEVMPPERNINLYWENKAKDVLKELEFCESYNYNFWSKAIARDFKVNENNLVEIANPLSAEQQYLKGRVYPGVINNIKENLKYFEKVRIFELGKEYRKNGKGAEEKRVLSGAVIDKNYSGEEIGFYELKGVLDVLLKEFGLAKFSYKKPVVDNSFALAEINSGNEIIGFLGISKGINFFEINFEKLQKLSVEKREYKQISQHPIATRDVSTLVMREVPVEEVLSEISAAGGELLKNVETFDVYEGEELAGKKSLAFHITFQAEDRTLNSEEINGAMKNIIQAIQKSGWEIRR